MIDPDTFRAVLGRFASGVTVVTVRDGSKDYGMTVSAFCSVSLEPPLALICVNHVASMFDAMTRAEWFGVNVLSMEQEAISRRFADPDCERFDDLPLARGQSGVVLLDGTIAHAECRVTGRHEAGDHTIFIGSVERAVAFDGRPLLYYRGGYAQLER